ncbi:hypothetical protein [Brucella oryzae]|uniref:Uncharacterized protein n=1 Tax=Brucella oryzae TaxID=335286 RepID=A0A2S7J4Z9_9HYPH|nr:hypothetical protein [Brucella oryzae]PQA75303.1 hypothetical protein C3731_01635 [Brucella oryzae]
MARFRHSASITNATEAAAIISPKAPQARGGRGAGLSRHHAETGELGSMTPGIDPLTGQRRDARIARLVGIRRGIMRVDFRQRRAGSAQ